MFKIYSCGVSLVFLLFSSLACATSFKDAYVVVKDGHLYCNDERIRFWGAIGSLPPKTEPDPRDPYKYNIMLVDRLEAYGFNMVRLWHHEHAVVLQNDRYQKGDASRLDIIDHFIWLLKERGFKIWSAGTGGGYIARSSDVNIIDEPLTAGAWQEAVQEMSRHYPQTNENGVPLKKCPAVAWDPRLEKIAIRNMKRFSQHYNQHTQLCWSDDPVMGIWELSNEQWWIQRMVSGSWQTLPPFFKQQLIAKWHDYLRAKYGDEDNLIRQWNGLLPGESLQMGTILLAPMRNAAAALQLNDANPLARQAFESRKQEYGREDFNDHRGADVLKFLMDLLLSHKQRLAAEFKTFGKSCATSPLAWDTGIGYEIQSQFLHQHADVVAHDAYIIGTTSDTTHQRNPFFSGLEEMPRISMGVPWLEHNKVEGKPFLCYETQIAQPAKYRSEFPYRLLFLASIQDWDAICWHYLGPYDFNTDHPYRGKLSSPGPGAFQYHYTFDEVQLSAMRAAAEMFTHFLLKPAAHPTTFIYGRKSLYDPESMSYGMSYGRAGLDMLATTYRYGVRLLIDALREDDEIVGPVVKEYSLPNPISPTDEMSYNRNLGFLTFDAPGVAGFTGFAANLCDGEIVFDNGVKIRDINVQNPVDSPYPVGKDEKYVSIALTSTDGKPLNQCKTALISATSTSFNKGLDVRKAKVTDPGTMPVLVSRVGCILECSEIDGMNYVARDWNLDTLQTGRVKQGLMEISSDLPIFYIELERVSP